MTVVVGFVDRGDDLYNAAAVLHDGAWAGVYRKHYLPNYGVFDENRYFQPGARDARSSRAAASTLGVNVCEDIWYRRRARRGAGARGGAELIVNISASPYHAGKARRARRMLRHARRRRPRAFVAFVNLVGGQDELVFDGQPDLRRARRAASPRARCSRRTWSSPTSTSTRSSAPGCATAACARTEPRTREPRRASSCRPLAAAGAAARCPRRAAARRARPRGGGLRRARARHARLRAQERLRHASCSGSRAASTRRSCACIAADALGPRERGRRDHAVRATRRRARRARTPRRSRAHLGIELLRDPDRATSSTPTSARWRRPFEGRSRGRHRGEPPGAHPRQLPDGALEQVRLAGAHHRQQERDLGRLQHALRRHGRRLRGASRTSPRRMVYGSRATATRRGRR